MINPSSIGANLAGRDAEQLLAFKVAPKEIASALEAAREAVYKVSDAIANEQDTQINIEVTKAAWDAKALEATRADQPFPDRDEMERAHFKHVLAKKDWLEALRMQRETEAALGELLDDPKNREDFLAAMQKQLEKDQAELAKLSPKVMELTSRIAQLTATSDFLVFWPHYVAPTFDDGNFAGRALDQAMNAKLTVQPKPQKLNESR